MDGGGALIRRARKFSPYIGGDYRLKVSFEANKDEKIYGMGQYQQDILDLKGCNIELAHRNSQASIPFYVSSKGYGFFWHNPAIGSVSFGKNVTEWRADSTKKSGLLDHSRRHSRSDRISVQPGDRARSHDAGMRTGLLAVQTALP